MLRGIIFKFISITVIFTSTLAVYASHDKKTILMTGFKSPVTLEKCVTLLGNRGHWVSLRHLPRQQLHNLTGRYVAVTRTRGSSFWKENKNVGQTEVVLGTVLNTSNGILPGTFSRLKILTSDGLSEVSVKEIKKIRVLHEVADPALMPDVLLSTFAVKELKAILEPTMPLVKSGSIEVRIHSGTLEIAIGEEVYRDGQGDVTIESEGDGSHVDYLIKYGTNSEKFFRLVVRGGLADLFISVEGRIHNEEILAAHLKSSLLVSD